MTDNSRCNRIYKQSVGCEFGKFLASCRRNFPGKLKYTGALNYKYANDKCLNLPIHFAYIIVI